MPQTPGHGNKLSDTGEHDAVEDATPDEMESMAQQPASKLFVINMCAKCWVKRWVRGVRVKWAFVFGFIFAVQLGGVLAIRAITESVVRRTVTEVLRERKLITVEESAASPPLHFISQAHAETKGSP